MKMFKRIVKKLYYDIFLEIKDPNIRIKVAVIFSTVPMILMHIFVFITPIPKFILNISLLAWPIFVLFIPKIAGD